ncbi:MAG: spore coat associated protein CotJA [Clostridiales bacterium]|nr:spore coat associated protein CotJA [Clostridiales bacterium]
MTVPLDDPSILKTTSNTDNRAYATISVPWQVPGKMYSACEGLSQGTIFADLDQPYVCTIRKKVTKEGCDCG